MTNPGNSQPSQRQMESPPADPLWPAWREPFFWSLLVVVLTLGCRPISNADLWWDLSRGRAVLEGSFSPSRDLLLLEERSEADWLGGLPAMMIYSLLGAHGMMLFRLVALTAVVLVLYRWLPERKLLVLALSTGIGFACSPSLDPGPRMFDLAGLILVYLISRKFKPGSGPWPFGLLAMLFVSWANVGPGVIVGWIALVALVMIRRSESRLPSPQAGLAVCLSGLALCATPRGVLTAWDSLRRALPWLVEESWVLETTPWQPSSAAPGFEAAVFGLLSMIAVVVFWCRRATVGVGHWLALSSAQLFGWTVTNNLSIAAGWVALLVAELVGTPHQQPDHSAGKAADRLTSWFGTRPLLGFLSVALASLLLLQLVPNGWGLDAQLDDRMLRLALANVQPHGTAFASDVHSGGVLCWIAPPGIQLQDIPSRALLGGRLRTQRLLSEDLRSERTSSYVRDDGSQGGAWIPLSQRDTTLLLTTSTDFEMIRGLEPSMWKPLSLDSPVLPFARAGDARYAILMLGVLDQRELVNYGPWQYSPPQTTRSQYDRDFWGLRTRVGSADGALRQARVLRGMGLHIAALRVLRTAIAAWPVDRLREELLACQAELEYREATLAGQASLWRRFLVAQLSRDSGPPGRVAATTEADPFGLVPPQFRAAVQSYLQDDLTAALQLLDQTTSDESLYAAAMLAWEFGRREEAVARLKTAQQRSLEPALSLLVAARLRELE